MSELFVATPVRDYRKQFIDASDMPKVTRESGADGYITKPYEPKELLEMIKNFIG